MSAHRPAEHRDPGAPEVERRAELSAPRCSLLLVAVVLLLRSPLAHALPPESEPLPPIEYCSGEDEDGDGETDEGFPCAQGSEGPCTTLCGSDGRRVCTSACIWGPCQAPAELCNGLDDDCDGDTDEDFECVAEQWGYCPLPGEVGRLGIGQCGPECHWASCQEIPAERCNSLDDDGDGEVDEGNTCTLGKELPPEVCNYEDDNGNGLIDEGIDYEVTWGPVELEAEGPEGPVVGLSCEHERLAVLTEARPGYDDYYSLHVATLDGEWLAPSTTFCPISLPGDGRFEAFDSGYVAACHGVDRVPEDENLYWTMQLYAFDEVGNLSRGPSEVFDASHYQSEWNEAEPYWDFAASEDGSVLAVWVSSQVGAPPTIRFRWFDEQLEARGPSFDSGLGFYGDRLFLRRDAGRWLLFVLAPSPNLPPDRYSLASYEIDPERRVVNRDAEFLGITGRTGRTRALIRHREGWAIIQSGGGLVLFGEDGTHQGVVSRPWGQNLGILRHTTKITSIMEHGGQLIGRVGYSDFGRVALDGQVVNSSDPWADFDRSLGPESRVHSVYGCIVGGDEYYSIIAPWFAGLGPDHNRRFLSRVGCTPGAE